MNLLWRIKQATVVGTLAALVVGGVGSAAAAPLQGDLAVAPEVSAAAEAVQASVTPAVGGPSTRFTFVAAGFKGDPDDGDKDTTNDAEMVSFWINTPDGQTIRAIRDGTDKDSANRSAARASRSGVVELIWRAPADLSAGAYTLVAHGNESGLNVTIPFRIEGNARGAQIAAPYTVTPNAGAAGTSFTFVVNGFKGDVDDGDKDDSNDAEKVSFWINTPDGQTIRAIRAGTDEDDKDKEKATVARASRAGTVEWTWQAPTGATPGTYTLVAHGLESEREQVIAFEIR
jgi:hypothetical protein